MPWSFVERLIGIVLLDKFIKFVDCSDIELKKEETALCQLVQFNYYCTKNIIPPITRIIKHRYILQKEKSVLVVC